MAFSFFMKLCTWNMLEARAQSSKLSPVELVGQWAKAPQLSDGLVVGGANLAHRGAGEGPVGLVAAAGFYCGQPGSFLTWFVQQMVGLLWRSSVQSGDFIITYKASNFRQSLLLSLHSTFFIFSYKKEWLLHQKRTSPMFSYTTGMCLLILHRV